MTIKALIPLVSLLTMTLLPSQGRAALELISVGLGGAQPNGDSYVAGPAVAGGRYLTFESDASNLVSGDTNRERDIFVRDRVSKKTLLISVGLHGAQSNGSSSYPVISEDGRFVVFQSYANNLVPGDTNNKLDVFVRDLEACITSRVSIDSDERQANGLSGLPQISPDGRFVTFQSAASNLVAADTNSVDDIFLRDRQVGRTYRVSLGDNFSQANDRSEWPALSADGDQIAFYSYASNLVTDDTNGFVDIFVRDRRSRTVNRASLPQAGGQANGHSETPSITPSGRFVVFTSYASNLVPNDTNDVGDIFVRDLLKNKTNRVSLGTNFTQASGASSYPTISASGMRIAFVSEAKLSPIDTNNYADIYLRDRIAKSTKLISIGQRGQAANLYSMDPHIAADGKTIAFASIATNLLPGATTQVMRVYLAIP